LLPGKQHHTLYNSSNYEKKNDIIHKKRVKTRQLSSRKFLVAVEFFLTQHFCDQKVIVMDDEKYFKFSYSTLQELMVSGQTMLETLLTPLNTKLLECLVWCAISEAAVLTLFIGNFKGQAVNADVYITKCLPKMVKFI
jgi:hypothetical protein